MSPHWRSARPCVSRRWPARRRQRRHEDEVRHRRDVSAERAGRVLRADPGRDEGLFHVHQHAARREDAQARRGRQANRLEVLRRRIQPRQHGAADAQARRGGQGLRHLRRARHRASAGCGRLPERPQGAAAARLDRCDGVRSEVPREAGHDRLAAGLLRRGQDLRQVRGGELAEQEDRRPLPERRLRQELPRGPQERPRGEVDEHRQGGRASAPPTRASRRRSWRLASREPRWSRSSGLRARRSRSTRR